MILLIFDRILFLYQKSKHY